MILNTKTNFHEKQQQLTFQKEEKQIRVVAI
jgi:hypothetical protein